MDETYLTEAIILNRQPYKEDDLQVTAYSRDRGKLFLIARGGRKAKSKLAAHLEPLCRTEIMVVRGRHYDYAGSAVSADCFARLKSDYEKVSVAMSATKQIIRAVKEGVPDENIFELICSLFNELNSGKISPGLAAAFFSLKFLSLLGLAPELYRCVLGREKISPGGNQFDFARSGVICPKCRASAGSLPGSRNSKAEFSLPGLPISDDSIKIMRLVLSENFGRLKKIKTSAKIEAEIIKLADLFYQYSIN
jgi:DNA repair protein RecO (recombination protein O)